MDMMETRKPWPLGHDNRQSLIAYIAVMFVLPCFLWRRCHVAASTLEDVPLHVQKDSSGEIFLSSLQLYELVYPSFPQDGDFTRQKAETLQRENGPVYVTLEGTRTTFNLELFLNRELTRGSVKLRHFTKDGIHEDVKTPRCHYQGVVLGVAESSVSLSTCNGIRGSINSNGDHYVIRPLDSAPNQIKHVLYKLDSQSITEANDSTDHTDQLEKKLLTKIPKSHQKRVRRDADTEVKYLELGLFCSSSMISRYGDINLTFLQALDIVNQADMFFQPMNVRLVLTYIELWDGSGDRISISSNLHVTLKNFQEYLMGLNNTADMEYDAAHLILGTNTVGSLSYYGTARQNSICTEKAVSLSQDFDASITPSILAHVLAHNLYIYNDDYYNRGSTRCSCGGTAAACVMYQRPVDWNPKPPSEFSQCSIQAFEDHLRAGFYPCLFNVPTPAELVSFGTCGNGIVEASETCDCGTPEECNSDSCCDPTTCQLTPGSQCDGGECCNNCQFEPDNTPCRESINECDVTEVCTGNSGTCPKNIFKQDGTPCKNDTGYCYNGLCPSRDDQCQDIWGAEATSSDSCFTLNTLAQFPLGYCGYTVNETLTYANCISPEGTSIRARCGLLHCANTVFSFFPHGLTPRGNNFGEYCLTLWVGNLDEADIVNPSDVADGTKCDDGKICQNFECVSLEVLGLPPCPKGHEGAVCTGNGLCTSENRCLCDSGWTGEACNETAPTSSVVTATVSENETDVPSSTQIPLSTDSNATFPPPPPSIPPPFPTAILPTADLNATLPPSTTARPTGTSISGTSTAPTSSVVTATISENVTDVPPLTRIPPSVPTTDSNATFPPPPPSIPPPYPTAILPTADSNATLPPSTTAPPTGTSTSKTENATFPPPPPSIPPPFPTAILTQDSNATLPPSSTTAAPPAGTSISKTENATFPPPPPSIPPPFPTAILTQDSNATLPPSSTTGAPPTGTSISKTENATFPPPPPSIPPPFPTAILTQDSNATLPPSSTTISPTQTSIPRTLGANVTISPPPPSIPPPFPTFLTIDANDTSPPASSTSIPFSTSESIPPSATQPSATQPSATQPSATQPSATQPSATQPSATQPSATQPSATQPSATQPSATQPSATQPSATQPPATDIITANLKLTILDTQNSPLYGTSINMAIAGEESKSLAVPSMTNVVDVITTLPHDGSLGVVVSKTGYTSNGIRWTPGDNQKFEVKLVKLEEASVEIPEGLVLIETQPNAPGQNAIIQFNHTLLRGKAITAGYALTSDVSLIPTIELATNDNLSPIKVRALGALELTITDQDSGIVVSIDGPVDMRVPLDPGADFKAGTGVEIWTYNETTAFWEEVGTGTIINKDLQAYWSFTAPHLSWWMAVERLDQVTTEIPATRDPGRTIASSGILRTQFIVFTMVAVVILILLLFCTVYFVCGRKKKHRYSTKGTLVVATSEMELQMNPQQGQSNQGLISDTVALDVKENGTAEPNESGNSNAQAEIHFSK